MGKRIMRTVQGFVLLLIWGLVALRSPGVAMAAGEATNLDVVTVLDVSGSMRTTDPKRISLEGAKLFVDMMESLNSRAGFVAFDTAITNQYDLTELNSAADKKAIKDAIHGLEFTRGDTNIGVALDEAVKMLENAKDTRNKKMVLFFTDGNIDLDNLPDVESEEEKKSQKTAKAVASRAAGEGIRIYTIGLNAGKSDRFEIDPALITEVADTSDAICRIVSSAEELPGAFNDIFAHIIDSEIDDLGEVTITDPDTFEETVIEIPNESVLEANIILFTDEDGKLDEIQLKDPENEIQEPDDETTFLSNSDAYHMLKIIAPKAGEWILQLKGNEGSKIHVNLIFNYDITMEAFGEEDYDADTIHVSARLLKKGLVLTDQAIYAQMTAVAKAEGSDGTKVDYPMTLDENNTYLCDVPLKDKEAVKIQVHIEGANMYRDSEVMEYSRIPEEPEESEESGEVETLEVLELDQTEAGESSDTRSMQAKLSDDEDAIEEETPVFTVTTRTMDVPLVLKGLIPNMCKVSVALTDWFDVDDLAAAGLTYRVDTGSTPVVDAKINGDTLELMGKEKGSGKLTVTASDVNGEEYTAEAEVQVNSLFPSLMILIIVCAVVLCLLILLLIFHLRKKN